MLLFLDGKGKVEIAYNQIKLGYSGLPQNTKASDLFLCLLAPAYSLI